MAVVGLLVAYGKVVQSLWDFFLAPVIAFFLVLFVLMVGGALLVVVVANMSLVSRESWIFVGAFGACTLLCLALIRYMSAKRVMDVSADVDVKSEPNVPKGPFRRAIHGDMNRKSRRSRTPSRSCVSETCSSEQ